MSDKQKTFYFQNEKGALSKFCKDDVQQSWTGIVSQGKGRWSVGDNAYLILLKDSRWVLHLECRGRQRKFEDAKVVSPVDALEWLVCRGLEPPSWLESVCIGQTDDHLTKFEKPGDGAAVDQEPLTRSNPVTTPASRATRIDLSDELRGAYLSSTAIAKQFGVDHEQLRKRLERWRKKTLDGWKQGDDRRKNESSYLFQVDAVVSIVEKMIQKSSAKRRPSNVRTEES